MPKHDPETVRALARLLDDMEHLVAANSELVATAVLDKLNEIRWHPPVRHGDPCMLAAVYGADLGYDQAVQDTLREMAESGKLCDTCAPVLTAAADDYTARARRGFRDHRASSWTT